MYVTSTVHIPYTTYDLDTLQDQKEKMNSRFWESSKQEPLYPDATKKLWWFTASYYDCDCAVSCYEITKEA